MQLTKTGARTRMRTTGRTNNPPTLQQLFQKQLENQVLLLKAGKYDRWKSEGTDSVPVDDVGLASYHVQQLMSEIGEVLDADKRWKSHRNEEYNKEAKLEELADCFIVLMNITMFSGFDGQELADAIQAKLDVVKERISK